MTYSCFRCAIDLHSPSSELLALLTTRNVLSSLFTCGTRVTLGVRVQSWLGGLFRRNNDPGRLQNGTTARQYYTYQLQISGA